MNFRHAHASDLPYLYEICHVTGDSGKDLSPKVPDRALVGQIYVAPYVVHNPAWCWVAADAAGPAGYLVTTPDTRVFNAWMNTHWLPALRLLSPEVAHPAWSESEARLRRLIHDDVHDAEYADEYPAHLHIDFLPRAQGQGLGRQAFELFRARCREKGIAGFHLGVGATNTAAHAFYRKMGLHVVKEQDWGLVFGQRLV